MMENPEDEMLRFVNLWVQISEIFIGYPNHIWFETLNKPSLELKGDLLQMSQKLAIDVIRDTHPDRLIIIGGEAWSGIRTLDSKIAPPDENIIYTFHYYDPFDFTHYLAEWTKPNMPDQKRSWGSKDDKAKLKRAVKTATDFRERVNRPVFMGEFGFYTSLTNNDRVKWLKAVRKKMEGADIPWCLWAYANTFPAYDPKTKAWDPSTLKALGLD